MTSTLQPIQVTWGYCEPNDWCPFWTMNLSHELINERTGVYIIFCVFKDKFQQVKCRAIKVGQSQTIGKRLATHRLELAKKIEEIAKNKGCLKVCVTWAEIDGRYLDNVEAYLGYKLNPEIGDRFPDVQHKVVNLPNLLWEI